MITISAVQTAVTRCNSPPRNAFIAPIGFAGDSIEGARVVARTNGCHTIDRPATARRAPQLRAASLGFVALVTVGIVVESGAATRAMVCPEDSADTPHVVFRRTDVPKETFVWDRARGAKISADELPASYERSDGGLADLQQLGDDIAAR